MKIDYGSYRFSKKEYLVYGTQGIILVCFINCLFYQSVFAFLLLLPIYILGYRWKKKQLMEERKRQLNYQFKEVLISLRISVQAGYSVENAVKECYKDLRKLYSKKDFIVQEFLYIIRQIEVSVPVEQLLLDLGKRSQVEDIESFAEVFAISKRSGGDLLGVIRQSAERLCEKIEVQREIEAMITAKKFEQRIMSCMPAGIILYMQICSPGFLDVLYGNLLGVGIMTVCLLIYGFSYYMGEKIINIAV